jgi:integrase
MAYIKARKGSYHVQIDKTTKTGRVRLSETFTTKLAAKEWAINTEKAIQDRSLGLPIAGITLGDLFKKYQMENTPKKRGAKWEYNRLNAFQRDALATLEVADINTQDLVAWRDRRLLKVCASTVRRDVAVLSAVFQIARTEWRYMSTNPLVGLKLPKGSRPRDRRFKPAEIESILYVLGYDKTTPPNTVSARVGAVMLFAIETAMRMGEICALELTDVNFDERYLFVRGEEIGAGKNETARRTVPLSTEALRILRQMPVEAHKIFDVDSSQVDSLYRKARDRAGIVDLHFHDTRHEGLTRLAQKLPVLDLARMVGHKDLAMLMVYYNATGAEMAAKLG